MKNRISLVKYVVFALGLYSCNVANTEIDEVSFRVDTVTTRSSWNSWEKEETPLEWAETVEGTGRFTPTGIHEFYIGENPPFKRGNEYNAYVYFDWGAGFPEESSGQGEEVADEYYMQIQWSFNDYNKSWYNIQTPQGNGIVKVLYSNVLEDISAYAFPYSEGHRMLYLRMRTIHRDFFKSEPVPGVESQYKYDRSLFSEWSYEDCIDRYANYWGFDKPLPDGFEDDEDKVNEEGLIQVTVNFPSTSYDDSNHFSYELTILSGGYTQHMDGSTNFMGVGKNYAHDVGTKGGIIHVFATCENSYSGSIVRSEKEVPYYSGQKYIDISFAVSDFF